MSYILITIVIVLVIVIIFYFAVKVNLHFKRPYEKTYQEALKYEEANELDKAIDKYKEVIKDASDTNPILINTYLLLADAYHDKGPVYDEQAIEAIDDAIKIVSNKKINQEDAYLKSALIYKADFLKKIQKYQGARDLLKEIENRFTGDLALERQINRRLQSLNTQE